MKNPYTPRYFPEQKFGGFTRLDGTINFYFRINALLEPHFTVLDVGCGRGKYAEKGSTAYRNLRILKGKVRRVIGIDVDPVGEENPCIDEFRLLTEAKWPVEDESVDMVVSDYVLEHIAEPEAYFGECWRVLKPGGFLCLRTSNSRSYVGLMARLIPNRFHAKVLGKAQSSGRKQADIFPTYFRCNTVGRLKRALNRRGFDAAVYGYEWEPAYLSFNTFAYWMGTLHAKFAPESLQLVLFAFARKPELPDALSDSEAGLPAEAHTDINQVKDEG